MGVEFISLFSGIGGFDIAFERAGMKSVAVCEIDKNAQNILRRHFPDSALYDDVRKVGIATHGRKTVDLICGGFPCQDLSVAGKRAGLAGERSGLWFEFARVIDELEPGWVVIENVPGLLSSDKGKDFAVILQWLAERGYGVSWRVLDAQYFGVPQRRRRVFIVGSLGNGRSAEVLFEREGMFGDIAKGGKTGEDVAYSIRANPSHSGDKGDGGINTTLLSFRTNQTGAQGPIYSLGITDSLAQDHPPAVVAIIEQNNFVSTPDMISLRSNPAQPVIYRMETFGEYADDGTASSMKQRDYKDATDLVAFGANRDGLTNGEISPTLKHQGDGKRAHGAYAKLSIARHSGVRRLTPLECERLQGFPDGWTDGQSDSVRYRQLGNAVAVPVVEWIGKRIMELA